MAFTGLTDDLNIIQALDDEPNDVGGLTAQELKAKFDTASNLIKTYINSVLLAELGATTAAGNLGVAATNYDGSSTNVQAALVKIWEAMQDITQGSVSDGSITDAKLAANAVATGKIKDAAVTAAKLAALAVLTANIADGAVTAAKLATGSVTSGKIGSSAVTEDKLASNAVTSAKIADGAVGATKIENAAIVTSKIGAAAVNTDKLANAAVTADKLAAGSVTEAKLGNGAVTADKLASGSVATAKLGNGAVATAKLADGSVTAAKIASDAVSTIYSGTLPTTRWTGSAAPYTLELTDESILATDSPIVDIVFSGTYADDATVEEEWAKVYRAVASAGKITFYAHEKPTVALSVKARCIRK